MTETTKIIGDEIAFHPDDHFEWVGPLWVNASTSNFGSQTVPLDLTGYHGVAVFISEGNTDNSGKWNYYLRSQAGLSRCNIQYNYRQLRQFSMSDSGVYFTAGYSASNVGDLGTANGAAIPRIIYGLKGVVST